jgi:4'-phosphopantetheinyl transferase
MPDEVLISIEPIGDNSNFPVEVGLSLLSTGEIDRSNAFRFQKHRDRYIRGRALLRRKLGEITGASPTEIKIEEEERGKPYVVGEKIAFNLSHSHDVAFFAFSRTLDRLGVDIELLEREVDYEGLSKHYFTEGEYREMQRLSSRQRRRMFFKIWTAKEARMKLSGEGLHLDPRKIDLEFQNGNPAGYYKPGPSNLALQSVEYPEFGVLGSIAADQTFEICRFS